MTEFLIKLAVTIFIVLALAEVSRRVSPGLAGILSGLPLGAGLTMYFVAREQGSAFALAAVPWGILGLSSSIVFSLAYLLVGRVLPADARRGRLPAVLACTAASLAAFFVTAALFRRLAVTLAASLAITLAVGAANMIVLRRLGIADSGGAGKPSGYRSLLLRAVVAGAIVCAITGAARAVGSAWTGLFSGFPAMLMPLYIVLHYEDGDRLYPGIIHGFAWSVSNLVLFYLSILLFVPRLGLGLSFVAIYALSGLYLWALNGLRRRVTQGTRLGRG